MSVLGATASSLTNTSDERDAAKASGQRYLAFISYRRRDGAPVANWLRHRIGTFQPPRELQEKVNAADAKVGGRFNRVFLDMSYQRSHANFWEDHIGPSVQRSEKLLLLLTPSVFEKLPGGEPNWVEREIEIFLEAHGDPGRILLVLGPGAPDDRVPDMLDRMSKLWDWADLRFFSPSAYIRWRKGADYDAQFTKILAAIYDIDDGQLPALTREFERARTKIHRRIYAAGFATILGLSALATWALVERGRAVEAERTAVEQRDEAVRQRNAALVAQSLHLTETARVFRRQGSARQAMKLLLPALPNPAEGNDRPLVAETVSEAYQTLYGDRELGRINLPEQTTAATESGDGKTLAAVTPQGIVLMTMPDGRTSRALSSGGGDAEAAHFSADNSLLSVVARDGALRVIDLTADRIVARHPGLGPNSSVRFAAHDSKLAIQSASGDSLVLLDIANGAIAERQFQQATPLFVGDNGDTLLIAADKALRRLDANDLKDVMTRPLNDARYIALTKVLGGEIVMATGKDELAGSLTLFDPTDFSEKQTFRLTLGNVTGVAVSADSKTITVHTPPNLTFYERETGFPLSNDSTVATNGRFVGAVGYQNYVVATNGVIQVITPGKNLSTSYKSEDEADVRDVVWDADGLAFTTVTSSPVVTRWSAKDVAVRRRLALKKTINGVNFDDFPLWRGVTAEDGKRLFVAYIDGGLGIWDLEQAEPVQILAPDKPPAGSPSDLAVSPDGATAVRADGNGSFVIFDIPNKTSRTIQLGDKPTLTIQFLDDSSVAVEPKGGDIFTFDARSSEPQADKLDAMKGCQSGFVKNMRIACTADGTGQIFDLRERRLLWKTEASREKPLPYSWTYASRFFPQSDRIAMVDGRGLFSVRSATTGEVQWNIELVSTLSGSLMLNAINSPLLDETARAAIRSGAQQVPVKLPASIVLISPDERYAAVAFPNRSVQIVDLNKRVVTEVLTFDDVPRWVDFSGDGGQLAVLSSPNEEYRAGELKVYDFNLGRLIFSESDLFSPLGQIFHIADGKGFVVVASPIQVTIFPIWEKPSDLVAAISRKYPDRLTADQRHYFHID
ncbi:MAG TPA: hypothetical protein VG271_09700 [Beijerinckiaceae bacterium]|nr:hypothetical protein [Beijerinckiaceae bacterium]